MFTGLIRSTGTVIGIRDRGGMKVLTIAHSLERVPRQGDSIAVKGICLTALEGADEKQFRTECHYATLNKTNLKDLRWGDRVHLEPAMVLSDSVDGHLVQGHVSALVSVKANRQRQGGRELVLALPRELAAEICREGSVALDGVSLTVASLDAVSFSVQLIGETLKDSCLGALKTGDKVNLETDMLLRARGGTREGGTAGPEIKSLTEEKLRLWGYL